MDVLKLVRIFFAERTITRNKGRQSLKANKK